MTRTTLTTEVDCRDFVDGCLVMGTGGGGDPQEGTAALLRALADGLDVGWVDLASIDDDALTITAYASGSIAPETPETAALIQSLHLGQAQLFEDALYQAIEQLASFIGKPIGAIVPVELGASNSPSPLVVAARLGIPVPDGDYSGRAVPDEMQGTPFINGIDSHPFASVDPWGNIALVPHTTNGYMFERVSKMLSIAGIHGTSIASTPLPASEMKRIIVPNTLTRSLAIGRAAREATSAGDDPVDAVVEAADGWRLFDGVVTRKDWEDRDGYMIGNVYIEGWRGTESATMRIWLKNENHISWVDGEPWVCSPDLISILDTATGRGHTSTNIAVGDAVSVIGLRGLDIFRTDDALRNAFGPAYFGFDEVPYHPIETLV